jgi:hypothetical protein
MEAGSPLQHPAGHYATSQAIDTTSQNINEPINYRGISAFRDGMKMTVL